MNGQCFCCGHYRIEHDDAGACLSADLFGDPCGCFGFEPGRHEDEPAC